MSVLKTKVRTNAVLYLVLLSDHDVFGRRQDGTYRMADSTYVDDSDLSVVFKNLMMKNQFASQRAICKSFNHLSSAEVEQLGVFCSLSSESEVCLESHDRRSHNGDLRARLLESAGPMNQIDIMTIVSLTSTKRCFIKELICMRKS